MKKSLSGELLESIVAQRRTLRSQNGKAFDKVRDRGEGKTNKRQLACSLCGENFSSKTSFKRHANLHENNNRRLNDKREVRKVRCLSRKFDEHNDSNENGSARVHRSSRSPSLEESEGTITTNSTLDEQFTSNLTASPTPTTCPKCRNTYRSVTSYENHFASCIPYSSTSSSDEWDNEEVNEEIQDKPKRRPDYEEDVVVSDEDMMSDCAYDRHEKSGWQKDKLLPTEKYLTRTMSEKFQETNHVDRTNDNTVTLSTSCSTSPLKTFDHAFSIRSIVAGSEPAGRDGNLNKPLNQFVPSVDKCLASTTTPLENSRIHSTPTVSLGGKPGNDAKGKKTPVSNLQSVSTQVSSSHSVLPASNDKLKIATQTQCSFKTVSSSTISTDFPATFATSGMHPESSFSNGKYSSSKVQSTFVKPIPINVTPQAPKTGSNYGNVASVQYRDLTRLNTLSNFNAGFPSGSSDALNHSAANFQPQFCSPYLNYSHTPTETITMQDASGQVMRVQMPTVPTLVNQQTLAYGANTTLNHSASSGWQNHLYQQHSLPHHQISTYNQGIQVQNYQIQQQLQLQIQQQHLLQPVVQPLPLLNSNQLVNFQQGYFQQQYTANLAAHQQNFSPWLSTNNSLQPSLTSFQGTPPIASNNYYPGQQDVLRNDMYVLVHENRAFPAAVSAHPQIPVPTQSLPSVDAAHKQNQFSYAHTTLSSKQQHNGLYFNSSGPSSQKVVEETHAKHISRGTAVAQPCGCEICILKKSKNNVCQNIKNIVKSNTQLQFQNPTWSSNICPKKITHNPDVKKDSSRFKKILPAPQQVSVEGLAATLASSPLVQDGSNSCGTVVASTPAVVRPLENPLQKLSDQISLIGRSSHIDTIIHSSPQETLSPETHVTNKLVVSRTLKTDNIPEIGKTFNKNLALTDRKRPLLKSVEDQSKPPKRKYTKKQSNSQPVDENEKSIRVSLKRKEGESLYTVQNVKHTGCENGGSMKSLKIKAKIANGDKKVGATTEVVVVPNVYFIPIPSNEDGHRTVVEDGDELYKQLDSGSSVIEESAVDTGSSSDCEIKTHRAVILYEVKCRDTILFRSSDVRTIWGHVFKLVHGSRIDCASTPLCYPSTELSLKGNQILKSLSQDSSGLVHRAIEFLLKELPNKNPKPKKRNNKKGYQKDWSLLDSSSEESISGCARTEGFQERKRFDIFGWLSSKHRNLPCLESVETTKSEMPASHAHMRNKHLREKSPRLLNVFYSTIHGRGLFTRSDIQKGEMVIEYAGEVIRSILCDQREKLYESKGYGCYMFKIDEYEVVDATMRGNAARFINHSCDPNCKSKVVDIMGKSRIHIFALRKILGGEELTYDYNFAKEHKDKKIPCTCGAPRCRKFLN